MSVRLNPAKISGLVTPAKIHGETDDFSAAFWLCACAMGASMTVEDVNVKSARPAAAIYRLLPLYGVKLIRHVYGYEVGGTAENGVNLEVEGFEELVPFLSVLALKTAAITSLSVSSLPECRDMLEKTYDMLVCLGADAAKMGDTLLINGRRSVPGGIVHAKGDTRIAMACVLATFVSKGEIMVSDDAAVEERYPGFWEMWKEKGGKALRREGRREY